MVVAHGDVAVGPAEVGERHREMGGVAIGREYGVDRGEGIFVVGVGHDAHFEVGGVIVTVEPRVETDHQVGQVSTPVKMGQNGSAVLPSVLQRTVAVEVEGACGRGYVVAVLP